MNQKIFPCLLGSSVLEFDQYLAIYFTFSIAVSTSKNMALLTLTPCFVTVNSVIVCIPPQPFHCHKLAINHEEKLL